MKVRTAESLPAYCYRPEEVSAMINHCRTGETLGWLGDVITALACTGMRVSELASLRWADIDLESKRLTLTDESGRTDKPNSRRRQLKSGRSRSFPIHNDLLKVLVRLQRKDGYVFLRPCGDPIKPNTLRVIFVRYVIRPLAEQFPTPEGKQGFTDGRFHSFRHYFCSTCANRGLPERILMKWLGHANSEMIRHYYHLHDEEAQRRMNELDFLGGAAGRSDSNNEDNPKENVDPPHSKASNDD